MPRARRPVGHASRRMPQEAAPPLMVDPVPIIMAMSVGPHNATAAAAAGKARGKVVGRRVPMGTVPSKTGKQVPQLALQAARLAVEIQTATAGITIAQANVRAIKESVADDRVWRGASAENSVIANLGSCAGTSRQKSSFTIEAVDAFGEPISTGGDHFVVSIRGPARTHARIHDMRNGQYSVEFTPSTSGQYQISVCHLGMHLPDSPFVFSVIDPYPHAPSCRVWGESLSTARARESQFFEVCFRDKLDKLAPAVELEVFVEPREEEEESPSSSPPLPLPLSQQKASPAIIELRPIGSPPAAAEREPQSTSATGQASEPSFRKSAKSISQSQQTPKRSAGRSSDQGAKRGPPVTPKGALEAETTHPTVIAGATLAECRTSMPLAVSVVPQTATRGQSAPTGTFAQVVAAATTRRVTRGKSADYRETRLVASSQPSSSPALSSASGTELGRSSKSKRLHPPTEAPEPPSPDAWASSSAALGLTSRLDMHTHREHLQLWSRRETTDRVHRRGEIAINRHLQAIYLHEMASDPTGFAFGGVFPGTLHAHGKLFAQHRVNYSIGRAGTYYLHVRLRREGLPIGGSPFELTVLPGKSVSPGTSFLALRGETQRVAGKFAQGISGASEGAGCHLTLRTCDEMGNFCLTGGALVVCRCIGTPQLTHVCTDNCDGTFDIEWRSPPRLDACAYKVEVKINDVNVLGSPMTLQLTSSPDEAGASIMDHLWLGVTLEGAREFCKEIGFPMRGTQNGVNLDGYESRYVRDESSLGWLTRLFGPPHGLSGEHHSNCNLTGYDLCAAMRTWLELTGNPDKSVCEVFSQDPRWRKYVGRANIFFSHERSRGGFSTFQCMELGSELHAEDMLASSDETFFWLDYFVLRHGASETETLDLATISTIINATGITLVELGTRPKAFLTRAPCLFELFTSIHGESKVYYAVDCIRATQLPYLLKNEPIDMGKALDTKLNAKVYRQGEKEERKLISDFLDGLIGLKEFNEVVSASIVEGVAELAQRSIGEAFLNLEHAEFTEEEGEWLGRHLHTSPSITCVNLRASSLGWPALSSMFKGLVHQSSSSIVTGTNSTVTSLELDENCLGPEGCSELIQPLESKSLTYLSLDGNHLKDAGVETLASLLCDQTTLRSLSLRNNQFQAQGMKSLSTMLHENKALTHLDIDSNRIVESYCHTKWACTAKKISSPGRGREIVVKLGYQHVDGPATQGVAALARALKTNGTLTSLSISGCGISEKAYILLANALQASSSSKLMFLVCDGFSLTPETDSLDCEGVALSAGQVALLAALLKKNETLASLNIARTGVGEAGCKLIGEALHRSAASKVSQLKCDKFSTVGSTALSLESKYLSTADMLLLGAVLARNELLASLTIDGVRLPLKQLMQPGQQSVDKRVPLAGHVIIDFARGIPTSTLAGPAFGAFDDKDEGSVERQCFYERMLTSSGLLFPEIREAWRTIDKDVTIDGDRRISLQGFARGVASNPELAMVATVLTLQRDELSEFLVFRWRGARVPEVVLNAPEYATGKLSIRGVQIGTIGPMSRRAIGDKRKVDRLAERVRFARPRDWLRAVDFMPESVLSVHGKHCPQVEIQCLMGSGEEFSFSVEVSEWSFDLTGARIRLLEGKPAQQCCATLTKHNNADGSASCVIDNSDETRVLELAAPAGELIDCAVWFRSNEALRSRYLTVNIRQRTVDRTSSIIAEFDGPKQVYVTGQRLLLLLDGRVQEATVAVGPGINILRPTRHLLEVTGSSETLRLDLNTYNHCRRRFETAKEFRVARQSLCELLQTQTGAAVAERGGPKQSKGRLRGLESQLRLLANDASEAAVRHWCDVELLLHDAWAGYHAK